MLHGKLKLDGEDYVVLRRAEYERLATLAKAARLPELPAADEHGNYPAVPYARAGLARKLIRDRVNAGLTQRELARLAGIRFETLCRLEAGRHTPSLATMTKIDGALKRAARRR
ncbi:MAG: helix-turn-helix transcriptional regulator [Planctomycetes bacterium]|nr:helix-turn-helix transcriptional regulator [Planctomycetota bacterium]